MKILSQTQVNEETGSASGNSRFLLFSLFDAPKHNIRPPRWVVLCNGSGGGDPTRSLLGTHRFPTRFARSLRQRKLTFHSGSGGVILAAFALRNRLFHAIICFKILKPNINTIYKICNIKCILAFFIQENIQVKFVIVRSIIGYVIIVCYTTTTYQLKNFFILFNK